MTRLGFVQVFVNLPRLDSRGEWYGRGIYTFDPLTVKALGWSEQLGDRQPRNLVMSSTVKYQWALEMISNGDVDITFRGETVITFCSQMLIALGVGPQPLGSCTWFKFGDRLPKI